jgi:hypothetical protein
MELLPALANAGGWAVAVGTLLFVIRALARGDLIAGSIHRATIRREQFWRDRALAGTSLAEAGADAAEATNGAD